MLLKMVPEEMGNFSLLLILKIAGKWTGFETVTGVPGKVAVGTRMLKILQGPTEQAAASAPIVEHLGATGLMGSQRATLDPGLHAQPAWLPFRGNVDPIAAVFQPKRLGRLQAQVFLTKVLHDGILQVNVGGFYTGVTDF